jgi:uncharacterized protein
MERRFTELAIRDVSAEEMRIGGYAAVFNSEAEIWPGIKEKIASGAFAESLKLDEVRALWSHNSDLPLGTTGGPTPNLRLWEDGNGLGFDLAMPDTQQARDNFTLIKAGIVRGMSFGFEILEDTWWRGDKDEPKVRTLNKVKLWEVSPTAFPAYPQTSVSARDMERLCEERCRLNDPYDKLTMREQLRKLEFQLLRDRLQ